MDSRIPEGIVEKLKRANECIRNLESEIAEFLAPFPTFNSPIVFDLKGKQRPFTEEQGKAWDNFRYDFMERANKGVPIRIRVLVGEIVHHLRSSFDHVAWQLSSESCRNVNNNRFGIEFPVFKSDPSRDPDEARRYRRKVKCITNSTALARIDRLQPYWSCDPLNDPLWRIHDMDLTDKHRELTVIVSTPGLRLEESGLRPMVVVYKAGYPIGTLPLFGPKVNVQMNVQVSAHVAFGQVIGGEYESVIPLLWGLYRFTSDKIDSLADEF
jgi:hypothetical protein